MLDSLERASWHVRFALWAVGVGHPRPLRCSGPMCTVGVLAGTHWGALRCPVRMALVVVLCWWWWTCDADLVHTRVLLAHLLDS